MTELAIQPGNNSRLTRVTDVVPFHGRPHVIALCSCGAFLRVPISRWRDGSARPKACTDCARALQKRALGQHYANTSEHQNPVWTWR